MALAPQFAATPKTGLATISTVNTNRDGTGTIATLVTPGASGCRVTQVTVTASVTTTAQLVRLYRSVDSGTTWRLFKEIPLAAVTVSAGNAGATATLSLVDASGSALGLSPTDRLGVAAETANSMNVFADYADL
jgi:uncharacterized membrane-anchored protein